MFRKSREHLADTNLNYWQHLQYAGGHGLTSLKVAWYSFTHAIWPGVYPFTAEGILSKQCKEMKKRITARKAYHGRKKTKKIN